MSEDAISADVFFHICEARLLAERMRRTREVARTITKLDEAEMWLLRASTAKREGESK